MSSKPRLYYCKFDNGLYTRITWDESVQYLKDNPGVGLLYRSTVREGTKTARKYSMKRNIKRDGFKPGYNPGLGQYVGGPREYSRLLNEKGLIEVGNEYVKPTHEKDIEYKFSHQELKEIKQEAPDISDRTLDTLAKGND